MSLARLVRLASATRYLPFRRSHLPTLPAQPLRSFSSDVPELTLNFKNNVSQKILSTVKVTLTAVGIDAFIRGNQKFSPINVANLESVSVAQIAANNPIEDRYCIAREPGTDRFFFVVADGHSGQECSQELADTLVPTIIEARRELCDDTDTCSIADLLTYGFLKLDTELLKRLEDSSVDDQKKKAAIAGSCALMAYVDGKQLYLANTGDCRAVLGRQNASGQWEAVTLTQDHTAENPQERQRILAEHPGETDVLRRDRILGSLQPTRAFGDARYKVSHEVHHKVLSKFFHPRSSMRPGYLTPPYVTAEPEITEYTLSAGDSFLVLATDGLYELLSNQEIVDLVARHRSAGPRTDQQSTDGNGWAFVDSNAATHLLRNALGGASREQLQHQVLTIPPAARKIRDDLTCVVVHFRKQ